MTNTARSADGNEATVRLRRCRTPLPHTRMLYQKTVPRSVVPLELKLAEELPDVCARNGRPAVERRHVRTSFYDTAHHPRSHRSGVANWATKQLAPVSTILVGMWPVCDRCERSRRCYRAAGFVLLMVMAANLIVLAALVIAR